MSKIIFTEEASKPPAPSVGQVSLYVKTDEVVYIQGSDGVEIPLGSSSSITALTGDVSAVGPGSAVATVNSVGGSSAANIHAAELLANASTSSNTPSTIVLRDGSGNFSAGAITASLNGNANTATTSISFSGSLSGDVTGTQSATVVAFVGGSSAANIHSAELAANAATSANTASTIVERDASGNFTANIITAALNGNASTATNATTAVNFTGSLSGDVTGTQSATAISAATVTGKLLTGYAIGANTPISSSDSILSAFEKVQGQLSAASSSAITALTGDVSATGPGSVTATVNSVGGSSAANIHSAELLANAATSANTASAIVKRDASGNFTAGTITANLTGTATTAVSFTGSLSGDVTGTQSATVVSLVGGKSAADVATATAEVDAATSANTASTLVLRDGSGNFSAGTITAALSGNATTATNATTAVNFTGSLSGDIIGTQSATSIASTTVTGKLLTGYTIGSNTAILATDSILSAFEKVQGQLSATSGSAITSLTDDITASGPGASAATVAAIQGTTVSGTTGTGNVVFSAAPTLTGLLSGGSASFSSTISASNLSGTNTGDVSLLNSNSINLAFSSGQSNLQATLNISASGPDAGYIPCVSVIKTDGLLVEVLTGTPVQIGTTNSVGSAASAARSDHVHAITSSVVLGLLLTGYTAGSNTPLTASNSILIAFENLQAQISATSGSAITSLTGDVTASGPGASAATIQDNVVSNSKLAQMAANTIKGNNTGSTANALDLTVSQVNTMLGTVTTIGTYDSQTAQANGLDIVGNSLYAQSASISNPGMVNNSIQSFSGNKTFTSIVDISPSSTTALTINTSSFIFDSANNALGIGLQPSTSVMIDGINTTAASKLVQMTGYGVGSTTGYRGRFARGTLVSPSAVQSGDILNALSGRGYGASQFAVASTGVMNVVAGETFTNTSNLTYLQFSTTSTGSVTSAESMRVASTGVTLGPQTSSTAIHQVNGALNLTTRTITTSLTVDTTTADYLILCDNSGAITITLPAPTNGRTLVIKDIAGTANTNNITIVRHASESIEGLAASFIFQTNWGSLVIFSDGTNWFIQ